MQDTQLTRISNFLWSVSDDVLRDLYVRGKYRDVILPMTVLRRLDAVLEPSKQKVLEEKTFLDEAGITDQESVLQQASDHAFYNTSPFTLRDLSSPRFPAVATQRLRSVLWTDIPRTSKTSWTISNSATKSTAFQRATLSAS